MYGLQLPRPMIELWAERPDYLAANDGWGMCNTGWGVHRPEYETCVCALGGIGCNVDHVTLKRAWDVRVKAMLFAGWDDHLWTFEGLSEEDEAFLRAFGGRDY